MTEWAYARVSTREQHTDTQTIALRAAGVDDAHLVVEHITGAKADRPGLTRLLAQVQPGDRITVWRLDRLGRSLSHLIATVEDLNARDVALRSLHENIDTTSASGRLVLHIFGALAEFERELTRERTAAALAVARDRGKPLGRRSPITPEQAELIRRLDRENMSQARIARATGVSRAGVGRLLRGEIPSLASTAEHDDPGTSAPVDGLS